MPPIPGRIRERLHEAPHPTSSTSSSLDNHHPSSIPLSLRETRLRDLSSMVQGCHACPRMEGRKRVLSSLNGGAHARVMFIAEAPGRFGADRTGVPIHGDPTGNNFEKLLSLIHWKREDVFITNAVLCNPRDEAGNNSAPSRLELSHCSFHLESQIIVVDPFIIVTLGQAALSALSLIFPHDLRLNKSVGEPHQWMNRTLFPMYHPSPRALLHRNFGRQLQDFQALQLLLDRMTKAIG